MREMMTRSALDRMKVKNVEFGMDRRPIETPLLAQTVSIKCVLSGQPVLGFLLLLTLSVRLAVRVPVAHVLTVATAV